MRSNLYRLGRYAARRPWVVIGAWLVAFALAAGMAVRQRDLAQLLVPSVTYTAFGVFELIAVIWHWPQVSSKDPWTWVYVALLVAITATGAYGWRAARRGMTNRNRYRLLPVGDTPDRQVRSGG